MPDLFDAIRGRRSTRKYQKKPIPQELVKEVLESTGWAPSAHNAQPGRFIVLEKPTVKRRLSAAMAEAWSDDMKKDGIKIDNEQRKARIERFATAPVLIVACTTMEDMNKQPDRERQEVERDLAVASLGAALENLLLAASALGLGACWFCAPAFCKNQVRKTLEIPDAVEPEALIVLGYPAEEPLVPPRKLLAEFCFRDKWGVMF